MYPALLTTPSSLSSHPPILISTFISPSSFNATQRRHFRVSVPRCSSDQPSPSTSSIPNIFGDKKELTGIQPVVEKLSPPLRLATSALIIAGAIAAGYGLGFRFGGTRNVALGGAAAVGAAGGAMVYAMNAAVPEVAAVNLHNYVADLEDPGAVKKDHIEGIAKKYGVSKQNDAFNSELCDIYCRFVSSVIPPGGEDLKGDEVNSILNFKNALGIDDPDAASMHMEIGRRFFRQRLEVGDRDGNIEERRAFQKLIYVSTLVFGEASSFLLPWKRVFKVTDSQVDIAIRDNAQRLYASKLKSIGRGINEEHLVTLRQAQLMYRLSDELAEDLLKGHIRKLAEENITAALSIRKSRTRNVGSTQVVEEIDKILAFSNSLSMLQKHVDADRFARGVGPVSLVGGEYDVGRKIDDLKILYRAYVEDALSGGHMEDTKLSALGQLRDIFGLGKREAEAIRLEVTSKVYRKRLSQCFSGGDLEAAESKAAFLQKLCDQLYFDPQKASEIHKEIYRQKLQQCISNGELSDEDVAALLRLRVMLCVPQQTVEAAHSDICGSLFEKVVKDAIASGVDGYDADVKKAVRKAAHGLRLTRDAAMSIANKAVRRIFMNYVRQARAAENRTQGAKTLKQLIAFNTLVVTDLVEDIKGESTDTSKDDQTIEEEENIEVEEEWENLETLRKIKPDKDVAMRAGKPGQTDITLKDDLPERDRTDLYKTYLLYCLTGEVTRIPFGAQITTKRDDSEYVYLNQLGGILGLTAKQIVDVHRSLAEQAFKQQAEVLLADGQLTKERVNQLNDIQKQVGLPPEYAQKLIKSITTTKLAAAIETAVGQGRLNIKQIRELKAANVDLDNMISESLRENLYKKTVSEIFSSGTGEFDDDEVYNKIPVDLNINMGKASRIVQELALSRLSNSLIQAVSLLRQRNYKGVVSSLNDLLACDKAVPSKPLSWEVKEELVDLYTIFMKSEPATEKLSRLQFLLGISDSTAAALSEIGDGGVLSVGAEEEEFVF